MHTSERGATRAWLGLWRAERYALSPLIATQLTVNDQYKNSMLIKIIIRA